jgi:acyl-CoA thioesterase FadM
MDFSQSLQLQVLSSDCDPYQHLDSTAYLRFVEDVDHLARDTDKFAPSWFPVGASHWLPHKTYLELMRPVKIGHTLEVRADMVRASGSNLHRIYEFKLAGAGLLCAVASIHWICIEPDTGRAWQPPENQEAGDTDAWIQEPELTTRPPGAYSADRVVEWRDVDAAFNMKMSAFMNCYLETAMQAGRSRGWDMRAGLQAGFGLFVHKLWIIQNRHTSLGSRLLVHSWLANLRYITLARQFTVRDETAGEHLAQGHIYWVCMDPATMQLTNPPDRWLQDFGDQIVGEL